MSNVKEIEVVAGSATGKIVKVIIPEGSSVRVAFSEAGITLSPGEGVSLNGKPLTDTEVDTTKVKNGDRAVASKGASGAK